MKKVLCLVAAMCLLSISYQPATGSIIDVCAAITGICIAIPDLFYYGAILWNSDLPEDEQVTPFVLFISTIISVIVVFFMTLLGLIVYGFTSIKDATVSLVKAPFLMVRRCCTVPQPPYDL